MTRMKYAVVKYAIIILALTLALAAAFAVTRAETGCCTNPNQASIITCQEKDETACCPTNETENPMYYQRNVTNESVCKQSFFVRAVSCSNVNLCSIGCCCAAEGTFQTYGALCNETFKPSELPGKTCEETCNTPVPPPQPGCSPRFSLTAMPVKGQKKVNLSWQNTCSATSFQIQRCKGRTCTDFSTIATVPVTTYADADSSLLWDQYYTYKITARINSIDYNEAAAVYTGNLECWGKYDSRSFCISQITYDNDQQIESGQSIKSYLTTTLKFSSDPDHFIEQVIGNYSWRFNTAWSCGTSNKLLSVRACPADKVCSVTGTAQCITTTLCGGIGKPFGLFSTKRTCENNNYCFYDESQGNVNACYGCQLGMSCYDYRSKDTCETDNCGAGNCQWKDTNYELRTGVCIDLNRNNCGNCYKTGTPGVESQIAYNEIFDVCTEAKRAALSTQLYDCTQISSLCDQTCRSFDNERNQCADHSPLQIEPDNSITPLTNDECGLHVCKWFGAAGGPEGKCKKNADRDGMEDCAETNVDCEKDYIPPQTTVSQNRDKLIIDVKDWRSKSDYYGVYIQGATTYLCVAGEDDSPALCSDASTYNFTISQTESDIPQLVSRGMLKEGINYVNYYSVDTSKNLEVVKHTVIKPRLLISLTEPMFGVVRSITYNVKVQTSRGASCRLSFSNMPYDSMTTQMTTINRREHTKKGFNGLGNLYVKCKETDGNITMEQYRIEILSNATITNLYAQPNTIIEPPIISLLTAESDQDVVCKYSNTSATAYENMTLFPNYDETRALSYKRVNQRNLSAPQLADYQANYFYVQCKNKAGLFTEQKFTQVNVNTRTDPDITLEYLRFTSNTIFDLKARTNKEAICIYANNSGYSNSTQFGPKSTIHIMRKYNISIGTHTYYVKCQFNDNSIRETTATFTIDTTPPTTPVVYDGEITNSSTTIYARWNSTDNESGIKIYEYSVFEKQNGTKMLDWKTETDNWKTITNLRLVDGKTYYVKVRAQNNANLWSSNGSSDGVTVRLLPRSEDQCYNSKKDRDETDIDCGGNYCTGCGTGKNCSSSDDCTSGYCNQSSRKCAAASCTDGIKNQNETGIDCGGNCTKCGDEERCETNDDCLSGTCQFHRCVPAPASEFCSNGKLDPITESDIDCGKTCVNKGKKCDIGKSCSTGNDCKSALCLSGKCSALVDVDKDNVSDSIDNCVKYNPDQKDKNKDGIGDECDKDNDGMDDYKCEEKYGLDATMDDSNEDPDKDGLTNIEECKLGTDPNKKDTDGDGFSDGAEAEAGTSPLDPEDHPPETGGHFAKLLIWLVIILLLIAGAVIAYVLVKKSQLKKEKERIRQEIAREEPVAMPRSAPQITVRPEITEAIKKKREQEKAAGRSEILKAFDTTDEKKEELKTKAKPIVASTPKTEKETRQSEEDVFKQLRNTTERLKSRRLKKQAKIVNKRIK